MAHFYGFYFAVFSTLTPPVAVGVLAAIRISNAGFKGTVRECCKLGGVCLLLPFVFVAYPNVLDFPRFAPETPTATAIVLLASLMLAGAIYGALIEPISTGERIVLLFAPVALIAFLFTGNPWLGATVPGIFVLFIAYRSPGRIGACPTAEALRPYADAKRRGRRGTTVRRLTTGRFGRFAGDTGAGSVIGRLSRALNNARRMVRALSGLRSKAYTPALITWRLGSPVGVRPSISA